MIALIDLQILLGNVVLTPIVRDEIVSFSTQVWKTLFRLNLIHTALMYNTCADLAASRSFMYPLVTLAADA